MACWNKSIDPYGHLYYGRPSVKTKITLPLLLFFLPLAALGEGSPDFDFSFHEPQRPHWEQCSIQDKEEASRTGQTRFREELRLRFTSLIQAKMDNIHNGMECLENMSRPDCKNLVEGLESLWLNMRFYLAIANINTLDDSLVPVWDSFLNHEPSHLEPVPSPGNEESLSIREIWKREVLDPLPFSKKLPHNRRRLERLKRKILGSPQARSLKEESQKKYFQILTSMPLLGHLSSETPSTYEVRNGFEKIHESLKHFLEEVNDSKKAPDTTSLAPLIKEILKETPEHCPAAETLAAEQSQNRIWGLGALVGISASLAVPCFFSSPLLLTGCLLGGLGLGTYGIWQSQNELDISRKMTLLGSEYQSLSELNGKENNVLIEQALLPLAFWGTTAVPIRAAGELFRKGVKTESVLSKKIAPSQKIHHGSRILEKSFKGEKLLLAIFSAKEEFPILFSEIIKHNPSRLIYRQNKLMKDLQNMEEFRRLKEMRPKQLLSIKIVTKQAGSIRLEKSLDPQFLNSFGKKLANMLPSDLPRSIKISEYFLKEVQDILSTPRLAISPDTMTAVLAGTIRNRSLKTKIFDEFKEGRFDLLEKHLPDNPEEFGFDPGRLIGLSTRKNKQYYLKALKDAYEINQKLNNLMALSIFTHQIPPGDSIKNYLRQMDEAKLDFLIDPQVRDEFIRKFTKNKTLDKAEAMQNVLNARLKNYAKKIYSHKIDVKRRLTEEEDQLSLVEVPPELGIFRGHVGDDCATSHSFGYANSPLERVFIIRNKKNEDVGYVNGTHVLLPDGSKGFFINTVAGKNVSAAMTDAIFAGFKKAKNSLEVNSIVMLGIRQEKNNINFTSIRDSYQKHRGKRVFITFPDEKIRDVIDQGTYDSAKYLKGANYLDNTNNDVTISVQGKDRNETTKYSSIDEFIEKASEISQKELSIIFQKALNTTPLPMELMEKTIKRGLNLNAKINYDYTLLHHFIENYNLSLDGLKYLVDKVSDINSINRYGDMLFHYYVTNKHSTVEGLKYIANKSTDINVLDRLGNTILTYYVENKSFIPEGLEALLDSGANLNAKNLYGESVLQYYVQSPSFELERMKYLVEMGARINDKNPYDATILHSYMETGHSTQEGLEYFISKGSDIHATNKYDQNAVHLYMENAEFTPEEFNLFIKNNAKINAKDFNGETVLHAYMRNDKFILNNFKLIVDSGANIKVTNKYGETLLHFFTKSDHFSIQGMKYLLDEGVDIHALDRDGNTFLQHYVDTMDSSDFALKGLRYLVKKGADFSVLREKQWSQIKQLHPDFLNEFHRSKDTLLNNIRL